MSLKALASETLARLRGTEAGTLLEQVERDGMCSTDTPPCSTSLEHDFSQKSAINGACSTVPLSKAGTGGTWQDLSPKIVLGLRRLRLMPVPHIKDQTVWPEIVADAIRVFEEGWAAKAIELGWGALSLWGVEPSNDPDTWDYSLAVVMEGWPIVDVGPEFIILRKGNTSRPFRNRPRPALSRFLWEL